MDYRECQIRYDNRLPPEPDEPMEGEDLFLYVMEQLRVKRMHPDDRVWEGREE